MRTGKSDHSSERAVQTRQFSPLFVTFIGCLAQLIERVFAVGERGEPQDPISAAARSVDFCPILQEKGLRAHEKESPANHHHYSCPGHTASAKQ
jgi:hypothetical protein